MGSSTFRAWFWLFVLYVWLALAAEGRVLFGSLK